MIGIRHALSLLENIFNVDMSYKCCTSYFYLFNYLIDLMWNKPISIDLRLFVDMV